MFNSSLVIIAWIGQWQDCIDKATHLFFQSVHLGENKANAPIQGPDEVVALRWK